VENWYPLRFTIPAPAGTPGSRTSRARRAVETVSAGAFHRDVLMPLNILKFLEIYKQRVHGFRIYLPAGPLTFLRLVG
jgi:hypothetical protein